MGNIHDMIGFEFANAEADGMTILGGAYNYLTTPLPANSASSGCVLTRYSQVLRHMTNGDVTGPEYWIILKLYRSDNRCHSSSVWSVYNDSVAASVGIGFNFVDYSHEFQLKVAGSTVGTSVGSTVTTGSFFNVYIHVDGHVNGGTVSLHLDASTNPALITYNLTAGDITALGGLPNTWWWAEYFGQWIYFDDQVLLDVGATGSVTIDLVDNPSIKLLNSTADGFYTDQSSGTYDDINDTTVTADHITLAAAGDKTSHVIEDTDQVTYGAVYAMRMAAMVSADGSAGVNCQLGIRNTGGDEVFQNSVVPASGVVENIFLTGPDGSDWTASEADDTQQVFGAVV